MTKETKRIADLMGIGIASGIGLSSLENIPISDTVIKSTAMNSIGMVGSIGIAKIGLDIMSDLDFKKTSKNRRLI